MYSVRELMDKLATMDPDAEVYIEVGGDGALFRESVNAVLQETVDPRYRKHYNSDSVVRISTENM